MSRPNLPIITLRRGPWTAALFDPRPAPDLLGARFVHGGWIASLQREGRELLGQADSAWQGYDGVGLPETFESGLGWHLVGKGQEFMRPGAGRLIRESDDSSERHASGRLSALLDWEVEVGADEAVFRTHDLIKIGRGERLGYRLGYHLERRVRLVDDGIVSTTTFELEAGDIQTVPITWYAHPFFAQQGFDQTAFALPASATCLKNPPWMRGMIPPSAVQDAAGHWRLEQAGGRAVFAGLWGSREPSVAHLAGGGALRIACSYPLDHIVLWASNHGASIEPKWARTWSHRERATWDVSYSWV